GGRCAAACDGGPVGAGGAGGSPGPPRGLSGGERGGGAPFSPPVAKIASCGPDDAGTIGCTSKAAAVEPVRVRGDPGCDPPPDLSAPFVSSLLGSRSVRLCDLCLREPEDTVPRQRQSSATRNSKAHPPAFAVSGGAQSERDRMKT